MRAALVQLPRSFPELEHQLHRLFCPRRSFHKLSRVPRRLRIAGSAAQVAMDGDYSRWTQQQLVARIHELEAQLRQQGPAPVTEGIIQPNSDALAGFPISAPGSEQGGIPHRKPSKQIPKAFNASKYSTRLIALKFAYLGQKYRGYEHHANNPGALSTIEEELWKALVKTRLINPTPRHGEEGRYDRMDRKTFEAWDRDGADVNWDGCEYSKCGRTDRGVSAFGQVVGIRVRSNRPLPKEKTLSFLSGADDQGGMQQQKSPIPAETETEERAPFDDLKDELPYIQLLNRVLPPDIRVYAWCPNPPPNFSARFSCKERRYKYFFTNPSFAPVPGASGLYADADGSSLREGWLDIEQMRAACKELIGLHDFRNFCKIDASKQLTNFNRRIFHADIEEVDPLSVPSFLSHSALQSPTSPSSPKLYAFVVHGSAFLWHQVRSLVAILFLIGQRLESPALIPQLLNISANPRRPKYEMASDAPLVLYDCIFPHEEEVQPSEERTHGYEDRLPWVYVGDEGAQEPKSLVPGKGGGSSSIGKGKWGRGGVVDDVWEMWRGHKVDETLAALLLDKLAIQGCSTLDAELGGAGVDEVGIPRGGPRVFDGGDVGRAKGRYIPVLQRERQDPVEVVNERYARRKGLDPARMKPKEDEADE